MSGKLRSPLLLTFHKVKIQIWFRYLTSHLSLIHIIYLKTKTHKRHLSLIHIIYMKTKMHKRHLVRPFSQLGFTFIEILKDSLMLLLDATFTKC